MEELLRALLYASLISAEWIDEAGQILKSAPGAARIPRYLAERWLPQSVALLERQFSKRLNPAQLWRQWDAEKGVWLHAGGHAAFVRLAEICLHALPDILRGHLLPTEVLFPGASTEILGAINSSNPLFDGFNSLLAETLVALIRERKRLTPDMPVRVLEVGAGTGATTALVLERLLAAGHVPHEYCFTDLSRLFLADAERRFAAYPGVLKTQLFNIAKSPFEQQLSLGAYDFVIGSNVVHAAANIRSSLRNIKTLLKKNGVLLLGELGAKTLFGHVTFGLLEGWWLYEDEVLRIPGTPLLGPETWVRVLRSEGFPDVVVRPAPIQDFGHQILIAESDGFVRLASHAPYAHALEAAAARNAERIVREPVAQDVSVLDVSSADPVKDMLRQTLAEVLGMASGAVSDYGSFFEYGMDSLIAGRLVNRINRSLNISLRVDALFEHRTISTLAQHIAAVSGLPRYGIHASPA